MSHRIVKVAKELNRPIKELIELLSQYGYVVESKPTAMVSDELINLLLKHYGGYPIDTNSQNLEAKIPEPTIVTHIKREIEEDHILFAEPKKPEEIKIKLVPTPSPKPKIFNPQNTLPVKEIKLRSNLTDIACFFSVTQAEIIDFLRTVGNRNFYPLSCKLTEQEAKNVQTHFIPLLRKKFTNTPLYKIEWIDCEPILINKNTSNSTKDSDIKPSTPELKYPIPITRIAIEYNVSTTSLIKFFSKKFKLNLSERSKLSQTQVEFVEKEFAKSKIIKEQASKPNITKIAKPKNINTKEKEINEKTPEYNPDIFDSEKIIPSSKNPSQINKPPIPKPIRTRKALRKIKKKKAEDQDEIQANKNWKWKSLFGLLKTRNPQGGRGFGPGGLWPVKK